LESSAKLTKLSEILKAGINRMQNFFFNFSFTFSFYFFSKTAEVGVLQTEQ